MKANEFVKKFGIDKAKSIVDDFEKNPSVNCCFDSGLANGLDKSWCDICVYDLKSLVESHELVESYGGLDQAKSKLEYFDWMPMGGSNHMLLSKAIIDVESCQ